MNTLLSLVAGMVTLQDTLADRVRSVPHVDLERYAGTWHEIARFPNRFQAKCSSETMARYELLPSGDLRVVNTCRRTDGRTVGVEGRARVAERDGPNSRLKVRFAPAFLSFLPIVLGDYWVLDLTDDYSAALVGTPNHAYLWVLARTVELDESVYQRLVATAANQGFDISRLVKTK